ncbi:ATP-binding protein [Natrinema sp. SYSU A 869]|uniref:ATP-binding protein n=1 Tax=Natrinema sp. SYSU A 869 TaxID=2871694 RepID=UPI001CA42987|nr:ATP-binding protein [Natrinema sp. SYSU A 869]
MQSSGDFFEQIVETVGTGVAVYGSDGTYRYVNPAYAALLETTRDALEERPIWTINPELDRDRFDDYWHSFEIGETRVAETRHEVEGTSTPVMVVTTCNEIDGTVYHYGTIQDITDRKQREEALEYQRSVLKSQQEATIDGILVVDENRDIVTYNDRFAEIGSISTALVESGDDTPVFQRVVEQVKYPDEFRERVEYLYDHPSETSRDEIEFEDGRVFDRYSTAITGNGTYYGRLWVFRDITDRVERERLLQRQNDSLEEFASLVSHDLRNPLNVATGHLELAAAESDSDHVEIAMESLDRMAELLEDMLSLARNGQGVRDIDSVSVSSLANRCWQNVETGAATLRLDDDLTVQGDESRLAQLFENLFRNAVEHGDSTVTVTVGALPDGFYVEDDGPGIPLAERDTVFESGYSTNERGTGFGLRIVTDIIDGHDWEISITDGTDGGARFEVTNVDVGDESADRQFRA